MSFINQSQIADAFTSYSTIYHTALQALREPDMFWEQLATLVPSNSAVTQHNWLGDLPGMREWDGDRRIKQIEAHGYTLENLEWESSIEVKLKDFEDDTLGIYRPHVASMPRVAMEHRLDLLVTQLATGFTATGYDGLAFFSDSHESGDNLLTASLDDTGAFASARTLMAKVVDDSGHPMRVTPTHLIYGPGNIAVAEALLEAQLTTDGASNTNYKRVQPVMSPLLVDNALGIAANDWALMWFLVDLSKPIKPLIFQMRREIEFHEVIRQEDADVFMRRAVKFGVDARYNAGYGLHQLAVGSTGAA
jgi:phage major head subunit gpT-like protein